MKTKEERMIDFVAKSYEEGCFDVDKAEARLLEKSKDSGVARYHRKRHFLLRGIAGAAAVLAGVFLYTSWRNSWIDYTAFSVPQTFTLPDSTLVTLAPGATLRLQRHKDDRLVRMTGKIFFDVRKDSHNPFRVEAGRGFVKVLGTRFQIEDFINPDSVCVSVISGSVMFSSSESGEGLTLSKGCQGVLAPMASRPSETMPAHPNPAAWATGEFIYDNTPLPEVLSELSEYYGVTFCDSVASDEGEDNLENIGSRRLSGEFSTSSITEILSLINSALGTDLKIQER